MPTIASSATSVLIAHVGARTRSIRLGAGGVMLPNHSPLTIAEQFGTLEAMYPGRIDLGLGRAPGSDQNTLYALRRDPAAADAFPQDVLELQAYLAGESRVPGVDAIPGKGSRVPLHVLGSSLFGARLAAALGLPYAFASHFAPAALQQAVGTYREQFRPSEQLDRPYVLAGVNVLAADTPPTTPPVSWRQPGGGWRWACSPGAGTSPTRRPTSCSTRGPACTSTGCSHTPPRARPPRYAIH